MAYTNVWHLGIDEAGLGPNLGPMVVASCMFVEHLPLVNLQATLTGGIGWLRWWAKMCGKRPSLSTIRNNSLVEPCNKPRCRFNRCKRFSTSRQGRFTNDLLTRALPCVEFQVEHHALPCLNADNTDKPIRSLRVGSTQPGRTSPSIFSI